MDVDINCLSCFYDSRISTFYGGMTRSKNVLNMSDEYVLCGHRPDSLGASRLFARKQP